jgi:hypothetical protein
MVAGMREKMIEVDVTLVTTRRPDLLARTLESFARHLFDRVCVRRAFINIDPLWGDGRDEREVESICRAYFYKTAFRKPERPSLGAAVKWLWSQPETDWFLHLEDDWILRRAINIARLAREMRIPKVVQIQFNRDRKYILRHGAVRPKKFSTGPSLVYKWFGHSASALMNPDLDPEKQFYNGLNPRLTQMASRYLLCYHGGWLTRRPIRDIGRDWRKARGIEKSFVDGRCVWTEPGSAAGAAEQARWPDIGSAHAKAASGIFEQ